ncbi:thrombospondin [Micromonospora krabiensis]|uniref:DMT family transporter n=1 Tax=Micromonospora krabiensis TaxID=307121 RepID=UPI001E303625|nr:DMT family transporter [Micromonospora krabiensis]
MKIPSLSRRSEPSSTRDENERANPAVDGRDETRPAATGPAAPAGVDPTAPTGPGRVPTGRDAERTTYRGGAVTDPEPTSDTERRAAERAAVARAATIRPTEAGARADRDATVVGDDRDRTVRPDRDRPAATDADPVTPAQPVARGPKPRASLLATLGLVVSVAGALFVLTGTLAGYGIGLGAVGAVLAVLGLVATRRRHIAGKTDALFGIAFGVGAVVVGILAMTGQFDWPTTDGDWVQRFREWLDSQFVDRF